MHSDPASSINRLSDAQMATLTGLRSPTELQAVRELWIEWAQKQRAAGVTWQGWVRSWWQFSRAPAALRLPNATERLT